MVVALAPALSVDAARTCGPPQRSSRRCPAVQVTLTGSRARSPRLQPARARARVCGAVVDAGRPRALAGGRRAWERGKHLAGWRASHRTRIVCGRRGLVWSVLLALVVVWKGRSAYPKRGDLHRISELKGADRPLTTVAGECAPRISDRRIGHRKPTMLIPVLILGLFLVALSAAVLVAAFPRWPARREWTHRT